MKNILKFLNETSKGRTIQRFVKTFVYACISFYVVNKIAPFSVDWVAMVEIGLLTGLGFGVDKGIREYRTKN